MMIKCSNCGKMISDKAVQCPDCKAPVNNSFKKNPVVITGIISLLITVIFLISTNSSCRGALSKITYVYTWNSEKTVIEINLKAKEYTYKAYSDGECILKQSGGILDMEYWVNGYSEYDLLGLKYDIYISDDKKTAIFNGDEYKRK